MHCKRRCWRTPSSFRCARCLTAEFAVAGLVKTAAAAAIAFVLLGWRERAPVPPLLALGLIELAAATLTTHAAARLDNRGALLAVEGLHQLGAAIWIGGIPCFLLALAVVRDGIGLRLVGCPVFPHVDGRRRLHPGQRHNHERAVYRRLAGALWHRVRRHGRRQDRHVPHAVGIGRDELPAGRAAAHQSGNLGQPAAALRRGGVRHRHRDLFRRRIADLGAAGGGSDPGPGDLAGDRRAQHAGMATPDQPGSRRTGSAGVAGEAGRRSRGEKGGATDCVHPRRGRVAAAQRRRHRLVGIQPPLGRADRHRGRAAWRC